MLFQRCTVENGNLKYIWEMYKLYLPGSHPGPMRLRNPSLLYREPLYTWQWRPASQSPIAAEKVEHCFSESLDLKSPQPIPAIRILYQKCHRSPPEKKVTLDLPKNNLTSLEGSNPWSSERKKYKHNSCQIRLSPLKFACSEVPRTRRVLYKVFNSIPWLCNAPSSSSQNTLCPGVQINFYFTK